MRDRDWCMDLLPQRGSSQTTIFVGQWGLQGVSFHSHHAWKIIALAKLVWSVEKCFVKRLALV